MESDTIEPEPPSLVDTDKYRQLLLEGVETLSPDNLHQRLEFESGNEVHLFRYEESPGGKLIYPIEAYVCLRAYRRAAAADKGRLEDDVADAMALESHRLDQTSSLDYLRGRSVALMNNMPLLIEPGRAMLSGDWRSEDEDRLHLVSGKVETVQQQKILLGGLAIFLAKLEGQDDPSDID